MGSSSSVVSSSGNINQGSSSMYPSLDNSNSAPTSMNPVLPFSSTAYQNGSLKVPLSSSGRTASPIDNVPFALSNGSTTGPGGGPIDIDDHQIADTMTRIEQFL